MGMLGFYNPREHQIVSFDLTTDIWARKQEIPCRGWFVVGRQPSLLSLVLNMDGKQKISNL